MPRVRLTGLLLFVTAILLGLASAATRTSDIRVKQPDRPGADQLSEEKDELQFAVVPIYYPLAVVAVAGLLLWFLPAAIVPDSQYRYSKHRSSRSGKSNRFHFFGRSRTRRK